MYLSCACSPEVSRVKYFVRTKALQKHICLCQNQAYTHTSTLTKVTANTKIHVTQLNEICIEWINVLNAGMRKTCGCSCVCQRPIIWKWQGKDTSMATGYMSTHTMALPLRRCVLHRTFCGKQRVYFLQSTDLTPQTEKSACEKFSRLHKHHKSCKHPIEVRRNDTSATDTKQV